MQGVNNRCPNIEGNLAGKKMGTFMDMNDGKGCVFFLLAPSTFDGNPYRPVMGLYDQNRLPIIDDWADTNSEDYLISKETADWQQPRKDTIIHIAQWLLTSQGLSVMFWNNWAKAMVVNPLLYSHGFNEMSPKAWPSVIMVDYIGETQYGGWEWDWLGAEMAILAVGLNQYMISENCAVSHEYPPLLDLPEGYDETMTAVHAATSVKGGWNGFIFANGTKIDHPPPELGVYNGPHKDDAIVTFY